jgi:hypothetical protein
MPANPLHHIIHKTQEVEMKYNNNCTVNAEGDPFFFWWAYWCWDENPIMRSVL